MITYQKILDDILVYRNSYVVINIKKKSIDNDFLIVLKDDLIKNNFNIVDATDTINIIDLTSYLINTTKKTMIFINLNNLNKNYISPNILLYPNCGIIFLRYIDRFNNMNYNIFNSASYIITILDSKAAIIKSRHSNYAADLSYFGLTKILRKYKLKKLNIK